MQSKPLVILTDSNNTLYRMFHTQPPRMNAGVRTESASATINAIKRLQKGSDELDKPEKIIAVFDSNEPTFRHKMNIDYKSGRKGMPDELKVQEPLAIEALRASGIPVIIKDGVEADDSLGMLSRHFVELGYQVIIVTVDKDMHQLVSDDVTLFNPITKNIIDIAGVDKKFGVAPSKVAEVLAISGDKEDGIIGIEKVGIGIASKWINSYGSLEGVLENAGDIPGKAGERLRAFSELVLNNLSLTTIRSDPSYLTAAEKDELERCEPDISKCNVLSNKYKFNIMSTLATKAKNKHLSVSKVTAPNADMDEDPSQGMLF